MTATLGKEVRRLASLAPSFRENSRQLVRKLWMDMLRDVLSSPTAEVMAAPAEGGPVRIGLETSPDIMQKRRQAEVERRKAEAAMKDMPGSFQLGSRQIMIGRPGRKLDRNAERGFGRE